MDSRPLQRLRHIHQLALAYMVYPGATHTRFEHSLGVMELATRIFDVVTDQNNIHPEARASLEELRDHESLGYWRKVVRMAALCHDIGHLPFSHAAEHLLPDGWNHERLSQELIASDELRELFEKGSPPIRVNDVVKLALGAKVYREPFTTWEAILAEIITGDALGADRMDYLLRDAHHAGVAYGRFDHHRLVDCIRILPKPGAEKEFALGIESGGLQSAESLLWARYLMYSQVYFHSVRRAYDIHLHDFLVEWLPDGRFSTDCEKHLRCSDNEILSSIAVCAEDQTHPAYRPATLIFFRRHAKRLCDMDLLFRHRLGADDRLHDAVKQEFGVDAIRRDTYRSKKNSSDFPVLIHSDEVLSSLEISRVLMDLPPVKFDYLFVDRDRSASAVSWLKAYLKREHGEGVSV